MAQKPHTLITKNPAHLFVGPAPQVTNTMLQCMQELLCPEKGCSYCMHCRHIFEHNSAHLLWLEPENSYTRDAIEPIFELLKLQRDLDDPFFIVITYADRLSPASANALLKSLEEPPCGYYFLLGTTYEQLILPTIRSRCIVHRLTAAVTYPSLHTELIGHFTGAQPLNPAAFMELLERSNLTETESIELLHSIMQTVAKTVMTRAMLNKKSHDMLLSLMVCYKRAALLPPQAGSCKIFWKDLYLQTFTHHIKVV